MLFEALPVARFSRRALFGLPLPAALAIALYPRERALPDPSQPGNGPKVRLTLFSKSGKAERVVEVLSVNLPDDDWRRQLTESEFMITRRQGTEFAFTNQYWNCHQPGIYRCVCCGNALFRSEDKFDSETGWPSFSAPCAETNIQTRVDVSHSLARTEVLCRKCEAHLGHVFDDGPPPSGLRYCLNSDALRLVRYP